MKFYKRFPGDITIKTGDLTLVEFGAYDRLLDHYYAKERPIEPHRVYTVARCQSAGDRGAVDRVLAEYWTLTSDGWVQQRADEMIAEAQPKIEAAKKNGKLGGRPKGSKKMPSKEPIGFFPETYGDTEEGFLEKGSQSQNQKESSEAKASAGKPAADLTKAELWEAGKSILLAGGVPKGQCGSFVGKLVQDYGELIVVDAVRSAVVATPADPKEYLKATCMRLKGERAADHGKPITQPMSAVAVAADAQAKADHDRRAAEIAALTPEQRAEISRVVRERAGILKAVS